MRCWEASDCDTGLAAALTKLCWRGGGSLIAIWKKAFWKGFHRDNKVDTYPHIPSTCSARMS